MDRLIVDDAQSVLDTPQESVALLEELEVPCGRDPRARGRATRIDRKTSHLSVALTPTTD